MTDSLCPKCGKSPLIGRAGSITSYFFQHNYCRCHDAAGNVELNRYDRNAPEHNAYERKDVAQICLNCGKSRPVEEKIGSFTAFLFKELRCQCKIPKLARRTKNDFRRTQTAERSQLKKKSEVASEKQLRPIATGTVIGGTFEIMKIIGTGGMGTVYLAKHLAMQKVYALKVLSPALISEHFWLRFQSEAKTLGALKHPNLVTVYDLGVHDQSVYYYSMDYLQGRNLEDILAQDGPLQLTRTLDIFIAVLDGLTYAHRHGIIHRDIKPANIFLSETDAIAPATIKILDFGIAKLANRDDTQKLTAVGQIIGSPFYMSPEQCSGREADVRSDIYSVGCSIFETLSGFVPFEGQSSLEIAMKHEEEEPPLLSDLATSDLPESIDLVVARCLAKLPQDRYQTAKELALDLERIKAGNPVASLATTTSRNSHYKSESAASPERKGNLILAALIVLVVALLGSALTGIYFMRVSTPVEPQIAKEIKDTLSDKEVSGIEPKIDSALEDEGLTRKVYAYLRTKPVSYSTMVRVDKKLQKAYYFPEQFSLGSLSTPSDSSHVVQARGRMILPDNGPYILDASDAVAGFPQLLQLFRVDELAGISISVSKFAESTPIPYIAKFTDMTRLRLDGINFRPEDVAYLNRLRKIKSLTMSSSQLEDRSFSQCKLLPQLSYLSLEVAHGLPQTLKALSGSSKLEAISLEKIKLTAADIESLSTCKSLSFITLRRMVVGRDLMEQLAKLPGLNHLEIIQCKLNQQCLSTLAKFKHLQLLTIPQEYFDNDSYKQSLYKSIPSLKKIEPSATDSQAWDDLKL